MSVSGNPLHRGVVLFGNQDGVSPHGQIALVGEGVGVPYYVAGDAASAWVSWVHINNLL